MFIDKLCSLFKGRQMQLALNIVLLIIVLSIIDDRNHSKHKDKGVESRKLKEEERKPERRREKYCQVYSIYYIMVTNFINSVSMQINVDWRTVSNANSTGMFRSGPR